MNKYKFYGADVNMETIVETRTGWKKVVDNDAPHKWGDWLERVVMPYRKIIGIGVNQETIDFSDPEHLAPLEPEVLATKIEEITITIKYKEI